MNILFFSLSAFHSIKDRGIYSDLLREFVKNGHNVYILSPSEKKPGKNEEVVIEDNVKLVRVFTGRITKTNILEKGINTILIEYRFISAVRKYFADISFDLVLYPTPPITLTSVIGYVKKRDDAKAYLMLKDIFPQNAVDIGMMKTTGATGLLYRYFRRKEKKLYTISDRIGCMSQANIDYVLAHNPEISAAKVEFCPNSIEVQDMSLSKAEKVEMRKKYGLPLDRIIFIYGGNLGKPQGIPFLIECLKTQLDNSEAFFLIVGSGTEYGKLRAFFNETVPRNMRLMNSIPKEDYDRMTAACDVGMIFLDHRFTIPNFPSRLLSYMQAKLPVLACTDPNTDIGKIIVEGGFGWWCESEDLNAFEAVIGKIVDDGSLNLGEAAFEYLVSNYNVRHVAQAIINWCFQFRRTT